MREIKFRGRCVGDIGTWAYGYYHFDSETNIHYIVTEKGLLRKEVIPETVGQFTGVLDKNVKKIYEGDVVKSDTSGALWQVCFGYSGWFAISVANGEKAPINGDFQSNRNSSIEVIGNIYDNKELIKL